VNKEQNELQLTVMPRIRAILVGAFVGGFFLFELWASIPLSIGIGLTAMLAVDYPWQSSERRRMTRHAHDQTLRLQYSGQQVHALNQRLAQVEASLEDRQARLQNTLIELERRDTVGAPEARRLIDDQKETLDAQKQAMEEAQRLIRAQQSMLERLEQQTVDGHGRWEETLASLERMLANQANLSTGAQKHVLEEICEGNRELQRALTQVLSRLAMTPRSSEVHVTDSVVMGAVGHDVGQKTPTPPPIPVIDIGLPQRTSTETWLKALPEDLA